LSYEAEFHFLMDTGYSETASAAQQDLRPLHMGNAEGVMARQLISSGSPQEPKIGFSRAVRCGPYLTVAGTAPIGPDGRTSNPGDVYAQAKVCLAIAGRAIEEAGGNVQDVVRTRVMLTDMDRWPEAARAHGEVFGEIRPVCTFVGVVRFIDTEWLVEVEVDCFHSDC
jgi:enamine deaminase RidA (YjgF/YER057c/UK114 family)